MQVVTYRQSLPAFTTNFILTRVYRMILCTDPLPMPLMSKMERWAFREPWPDGGIFISLNQYRLTF
jgi:hypothetical protein